MNTQLNLRLPENLLTKAQAYADKNGFSTVQEFIKETIRERLFEPQISKKELALVNKLLEASADRNIYGTEQEMFNKLKKKSK